MYVHTVESLAYRNNSHNQRLTDVLMGFTSV